MQRMTRVVLASSTVLLVAGCAKSEAPRDTAAAMSADSTAAAAPAARSLADFAGKWQARAIPESGKDTTATTYVLTATADTTGWTIAFPSGVTVKQHVRIAGDSVMLKSDTYASQRRKGAKVFTETTYRLQGDKLVGPTTAHYTNAGPDSVLHLRNEGVKAP
jgi:hypothetical protein